MNPNPQVVFTSYVSDSVKSHITVTADGVDITADVTLTISGSTGPTGPIVTITPPTTGTPPVTAWPAGATITITVDATAPNAVGQTIAPVSDSFVAM